MINDTDRELLEMAAKAAGYNVKWMTKQDVGMIYEEVVDLEPHRQHFTFVSWPHHKWNPLTDDGDALRLAVALDIVVQSKHYNDDGSLSALAVIYNDVGLQVCLSIQDYDSKPYTATRRAIVECAAQLGRTM